MGQAATVEHVVDPDVAGRLGMASRLLATRQPGRALAVLAELGPASGSTPEARLLEAAALLEVGRAAEAVAAAQAGLALAPGSRGLLRVLSRAEVRRGRPVEAERALLVALAAAPDDPALLADYAVVLAHGGATASARETLARAAALAPDDPGVRGAWARLDQLGAAPANSSEPVPVASPRRRLSLRRRPARVPGLASAERVASHPALAPLWPLRRFGQAPLWALGFVVAAFAGWAGGRLGLVLPAALVSYGLYAVAAPALVRRLVSR
ncbi:MAG: tetratricopeptide repeat protein [Thermoleophilia bacterium]